MGEDDFHPSIFSVPHSSLRGSVSFCFERIDGYLS